MSSHIPTFSSVSKPQQKSASRLPIPTTTVKKPQQPMTSSFIRPTFARTAIKRSSQLIGSSVTKKQMTPKSLLKSSSSLSRPLIPMTAREIARDLYDAPEFEMRTPVFQKENNCFNKSYEKLIQSSPISIPPYSPAKKIQTENKEINTDIEWSTLNKESEINLYKSQIIALKQSLSEAELREKDNKCEKDILKIHLDKLKSDFERFKSEEQQSKLEEVKMRNEKEASFQEQQSKLMNDILTLQEKLFAESNSKTEAYSRCNILESEVSLVRTQLEKSNAETELKAIALEEAQTKISVYKSREDELKKAQEELATLRNEIERLEEKEMLAGIFSNELKDLRLIEEENNVLKLKLESFQDACDKMKLLEVQVGLKDTEIADLKSLVDEAQSKIQILDYAQIQLKDWQTQLGSESPGDFKDELEQLKQNNLFLAGENEFLKKSKELLREQIECHEAKYHEIDAELQQAQVKIHEQDQALHQFEEKTALLEKQNELLSERFEEVSAQKIELCDNLTGQVESLNSDAKGYKIILAEKDTELFKLKNDISSLQNIVQERNSVINKLKDQNHSLEAKIEENASKLANKSNSDVRIVTFKPLNPFMIAVEKKEKRYQKLVEENARLLGLVEVLQSDEDKANMTVQINNVLEKNSQIAKLEVEKEKCRKVLEKERKNNHELVTKLRSHLTDLTGFKIYMDRLFQTVTLKHVLDARFKVQFKFHPDGLIEFVGDSKFECCEKAQEYLDKYLVNGDSCYPAFLAALTLDLFNQRL